MPYQRSQKQRLIKFGDGVMLQIRLREIWDDAVSEATGLDREWMQKCAELLAQEPTVTGKQDK